MLFAAPWMLLGLIGVGLPIVIHLLDRSRSEAVDWPTLRFLNLARQQSAQRARLKNILVLIARCLLIALIVGAMSMPYTEDDTWANPTDLPTTAVFVIDNSYSMGYHLPGSNMTRFERAIALATEQLEKMSIEDQVALVLVNDEVETIIDRPTADHDAVRRALRSAKLSNHSTHISPALAAAYSIGQLDAVDDDTEDPDQTAQRPQRKAWRQVIVFTDLQRTGFNDLLDGQFIEHARDPLPVTMVDVSGGEHANRFVQRLRLGDQVSGGALNVRAEVANFGASAGGKVILKLDDRQAGSPELAPAQTGSVALTCPLPAPGVHTGSIELDEDRLPIDDVRHFAIDVPRASSLTLVDGAPSQIAHLDELYYFNTALSLSAERMAALAMTTLSPEQLGQSALGGGGGVMLANVPHLDGSALARVENFLRSGGNVLVTLGDRVDIEHYNRDWKFLPTKLTKRLGDPGRSRSYGIQIADSDHPVFEGQMDLSATRYFAFIGADPESLKPGAEVLASFTNGSPALIEGSFGRDDASGGGRVLLWTGPIDGDWSNLPFRRVFVPLVDRFAAYLTQKRIAWRDVEMGQPIRFTAPASMVDQPVTITAPDGTVRTLNARLDSENNQAFVEYAQTDQIGVYRVQASDAFAAGGAFAVNLNIRESVLAPVDLTQLHEAFGKTPIRLIQDQPTTLAGWHQSNEQEKQTSRTEYWPLLLLLALAMFVTESALANYYTQPREAEEAATTEYLGRTEIQNRMAS